jgi:hypothetical protein
MAMIRALNTDESSSRANSVIKPLPRHVLAKQYLNARTSGRLWNRFETLKHSLLYVFDALWLEWNLLVADVTMGLGTAYVINALNIVSLWGLGMESCLFAHMWICSLSVCVCPDTCICFIARSGNGYKSKFVSKIASCDCKFDTTYNCPLVFAKYTCVICGSRRRQ